MPLLEGLELDDGLLAEHVLERCRPVEGPVLLPADLAVAKDHQPVGQGVDLTEAVGHVEDRDAGCAQLVDDGEQAVDLGLRERGRRLVEDEEPGPAGQGAREDEQLLVGDADLEDVLAKIRVRPVEVQRIGNLTGLGQEGAQGGHPADLVLRDLLEEQVLGDAQAGDDTVVDALMHGLQADPSSSHRRVDRLGLSVDLDDAAIAGVDAGEDLDEGALARSVGTEERCHVSGVDLEVDASQDHVRPERHRDITHDDRRL
jgi:hypothetical protein